MADRSLTSAFATSMRKPSAPRANHVRRTSSNIARTSGLSQSRSGCSIANWWRYHWPGRPSASEMRSHADPPKTPIQPVGGWAPSGPRPSRKTKRARAADPGPAASASANHGWALEVWFGTRSSNTRSPWSCASWISVTASSTDPNIGSTPV